MVSDRKKSGLEKDSQGDRARIDLGFSKLVSSLNESDEKKTPESEIKSTPENISAAAVKETSSDLNSMPFEQLADKQEFTVLQKLSEKKMTESKGSVSIHATIWWAISQLKTGGVPASILSTPVSKASAEIERFSLSASGTLVEPLLTTSRLKKECASLLLQLAKKNSASLNEKSIPEFLGRAVKLDPSLSTEIRSFIERELDRISKMTGRKALREARIADFRGVLRNIDSARSNLNEKSEAVEKKRDILLPTPPLPKRNYLGATLILLLGMGVGIYYFYSSTDLVAGGAAPLASYEEQAILSKLDYKRIANVDNLEVLLAKVNSIAIPTPVSGSVALGRGKSDGVAELGNLLENQSGGAATNSSSGNNKKLERVDTSGPIEGTEYYRRETQRAQEENTSVFGSEPPGVGGLIPEQGSGAGRGPQTYRVITFTRVYTKASFFSQTMANLESGARVEVVERFGEWLKIRSRQGQIGFMLAQDAEPVR